MDDKSKTIARKEKYEKPVVKEKKLGVDLLLWEPEWD